MYLDRRTLLLAAGASAFAPGLAFAAPPMAKPEAVGFSSAKLKALGIEMQALVDQGKLAGVTTLLARHGKVVHFESHGVADLATKAPLRTDHIFRIASMTKPVTGVAMMMLYEQGKWAMDDPVEKHIPEFKGLKVKAADGQLVEQASPMTMAQLMSHSAGFDVSAAYEGANLQETNLQGMIDKLAKMPLAFQPGTDWRYGPSVNIQSHVVEKLSGMNLNEFFQTKIFRPLKMVDTGFYVPPQKSARVVKVNTYGPDGKITPAPAGGDPTRIPTFWSGSGGLLSTVEDYWRFAQMVANRGELEGVRLLKPETAVLMRKNVLAPGVKVDLYGPSQEGVGFGMDFAVLMDPAAAGSPMGLDSHWWGGAFGTWFWIDPTNDIVFVGFIQNLRGSVPGGGTPPMRDISPRLVYAALDNPKA
ncbi:serine hydrolase domain-containing protein [Phenylobacterium sp.]|jgi:CubicO group peptidase (beta-lactamase class C family)|uniref:serine hydrolase domain-containing protein n=1 Tax=Phenylobacterium sp. TaxID=1871053 RepID=UPI002E310D48|nr:serine hydrolase domain-containing protein [Phenylobacterium sp.]HEX2558812.1 serine hydrolase domain-containing protein [Phenylobacterium sp.]